MDNKKIPQMEPWFDEKEAKACYSYIKSGGWLTEFTKTQELEDLISQFTRSKHTVMTNNGTISLTLAMIALGLERGDEILVPDLTMIASPNSAHMIGIKPVMVDIEASTLCMDLTQAEKAITKKTKALMYVSFNGRCGDMKKIVAFCKKYHLYLIEDSAQSLGSYWKGKHLGTFGQIGSFSFSVPKIITTGQGGALVTNSELLYKKIKRLKDFGRDTGGNDIHNYMGWNFKFTDLQAIVGIEQMKKLKKRVEKKKKIYKWYKEGLKDIKEIEFIETDLINTSPWFIDIFVNDPDDLASFLKEKGIGTRKIYPAIHTQKIWKDYYKNKKFPITLSYSQRGLWLPSSSKLTQQEVNYIVGFVRKYYEEK